MSGEENMEWRKVWGEGKSGVEESLESGEPGEYISDPELGPGVFFIVFFVSVRNR